MKELFCKKCERQFAEVDDSYTDTPARIERIVCNV